ncbi:MAG: DUF1194 domain-containing protein, partial [Tagaea sp.]
MLAADVSRSVDDVEFALQRQGYASALADPRVVRVMTGGRNGAVVEHFRIVGGGHTWPGSPFIIGVTNQDIKASVEVWR